MGHRVIFTGIEALNDNTTFNVYHTPSIGVDGATITICENDAEMEITHAMIMDKVTALAFAKELDVQISRMD